MHDVLLVLTRSAMLVFLVASMLDFGLGLTVRQILAPLRSVRLVILSLVANLVIVPALAVAIARVLRLEPPFAIGLLLLGLAPGAPFIPRVVQLARYDPGFAVGLMVLLTVGTVVYLPLVLPMLIAGAEIDAWQIGRSLLLLLLLPLLAGLTIHARFHSLPGWLRPSLGLLSNLTGLVVLVLILALNSKSLLDTLGTGAVLASALFVVLSALAGWLMGGADRGTRDVLGLGTGLRNVAAALLVGSQNFKDPGVNVMVIVSALVGLLILLPVACALGRRSGPLAGPEGGGVGQDSIP